MRERGSGSLFRERYRDRTTGQLKVCRTWMMKLWVGGKPLKRSARTTSRAVASHQLEQWKAQIRQGTYVPDADQTRFDDLATLLLDEYRANGRKSLGRAAAAVDHLKEFFTGWRAQALSSDRVLGYVRHRQQQRAANATINRELAALKRMFRLGERAGRIVRRPFIDLLQERNARTGFFERAECDAVLAACKVANVRHSIGYRLFWDPYHTELRRLAREQDFGPFKKMKGDRGFVMGTWRWRADKKLAGGGPLMDLCGRAVGVNTSSPTRFGTEAGFSLAEPTAALLEFLKANGKSVSPDTTTCAPVGIAFGGPAATSPVSIPGPPMRPPG